MGKKIHYLSSIDEEARTAVCAHCGPVRLKKKHNGWRCNQAEKKWAEKRVYVRHKGDICTRCGFVPEHTCQLDVHHLDGDHSNNELTNLQTLCANCHRLVHYGKTPASEG